MSFPPPTEPQARLLWSALAALAIGLLLAMVGLRVWGGFWVITRLSSVLLPLAIAGILAYLLDPVVDFLENRRIPRTRAILMVFFRGQVLVALCDGVLLTVGFLMLGLNYAVLLGFVAGLLSIVPYLGIMLSLIPALALAAIQFGDWWHPALVLVIFGLVQTLEGLVISPKIIGDRVGLHPLTIIIAVMVGTTLLGGLLGGVLAIPLTAALRVIMFRYVWR